MSEVREFKTESKRLLELMINSIYTNKEIFLRELISNASDAMDKHHYLSLTDDKLNKVDEYQVFIKIDKKKKTLSVIDKGIGMTCDEVVNNLGTIARSGSLEFMKNINEKSEQEKLDIIGQFGVGFYSAYMVAEKVVVETFSPFATTGYTFSSNGTENYEISETKDLEYGTKVILYFRKDTENDKFSKYLDDYEIRSLVKKYSDYIRYPIKMEITREVPKLDQDGNPIKDKYEKKTEIETLNSMTPIWKKKKNEVSDEELNDFYKQKYYDYQDPLTTIFVNVEGALNYTALVYIPKKAPYDLYYDKYEKGLQLYSKGVFIMDKCKELVPDYLRFMKGLVDSSDLSLNISREILQQTHELDKIAKNIEKKIVSRLEKMLKEERELYTDFFENYGLNIKFGVYDQYGLKKDMLQDLLLYKTVNKLEMVTLKEYVDGFTEGQEHIYYASGKTKEAIMSLPQMDLIKKQGYDVLMLTDDIDEFVINIMQEYSGKKFKSINQGDLDLLSKEEKEKIDNLATDKKTLLEKLKEILKDEVVDVVLSKRLTDSPVCLVSGDGMSFEMEKVMAAMPNAKDAKASRILEINPNHKLFETIEHLYNDDNEALNDYAYLLYNQALLIEGFSLKDPVEFTQKMCDLMIKGAKY